MSHGVFVDKLAMCKECGCLFHITMSSDMCDPCLEKRDLMDWAEKSLSPALVGAPISALMHLADCKCADESDAGILIRFEANMELTDRKRALKGKVKK